MSELLDESWVLRLLGHGTVGCDDTPHYHWLIENLSKLVWKMADLIAKVSAMQVLKYLP